jgi:ubiquinone/menaquinone biosynthesis C-methylase UbiE
MSTLWGLRSRLYDVFEGSGLRRGPSKARLFAGMSGKTLFLAMGTGLDVRWFPDGRDIVALDISEEMIRRSARRATDYHGSLSLVQADATRLCFIPGCFDTVVTSCTLCSVPDPASSLRELHRVLRPGGRLLMYEHVRSRNPLFALALDLMTLWTRLTGTEMNRETLRHVREAGFDIIRVHSVFLDVIVAVSGEKSAGATALEARDAGSLRESGALHPGGRDG